VRTHSTDLMVACAVDASPAVLIARARLVCVIFVLSSMSQLATSLLRTSPAVVLFLSDCSRLSMSKFYLTVTCAGGLTPPWTMDCGNSCTVGMMKSWIVKHYNPTNIPLQEMQLFAMNRAERDEDELADATLLRAYAGVGLLVQRKATLATLQRHLPHISRSTRQSLHAHLRQMPIGQVDVSSIEEQVAHQDADVTAALRNRVCVVNLTHDGHANQVTFDGEKLIPYRLLPNDGGVELRGKYVLTIHNLSIESISQIIVIKLITRRDVHECHHMR
jgi:hypothetical protein